MSLGIDYHLRLSRDGSKERALLTATVMRWYLNEQPSSERYWTQVVLNTRLANCLMTIKIGACQF